VGYNILDWSEKGIKKVKMDGLMGYIRRLKNNNWYIECLEMEKRQLEMMLKMINWEFWLGGC